MMSASLREMTSQVTSVMTDKELFQKEKWQNMIPKVAPPVV